MAVQNVRVNLLGSSFVIMTDESPVYVQSILDELSKRIDNVKQSTKVNDPLKVSILTAIFLVDELNRTKSDTSLKSDNQQSVDFSELADRLIAKIDDSLIGTDKDNADV